MIPIIPSVSFQVGWCKPGFGRLGAQALQCVFSASWNAVVQLVLVCSQCPGAEQDFGFSSCFC